jgi:phospholipid/cholesterol/gamma-HCH transport system permease protein
MMHADPRSMPSWVAGWIQRQIAAAGSALLAAGTATRELWGVYIATWAGVARLASRRGIESRGQGRQGRPRGEILHQLYWIGNRSIVFIAVTLGFLGMVMAYEACLQLSRVTGDFSQVGAQLLKLDVSDFAATLTGLMLATRVGAGIAAEIGSMKVTEQIDALRMNGVLPIDYLIVPRFIASLVMTLALSVLGGVVMYAASGLTAKYSFAVNPGTFFDPSMVRVRHVALLVIKAAAYGAAIPVVAGFCGLRARGSSEGVGSATTAAVIGGSFSVIVLDFAISAAALLVFGSDL